MGRPSRKTERREQILNAYEDCVARFGVEGASLEKVAEAAGLARPLIRHNVGNRDELLSALVDRFLASSDQSVGRMIAALPETNRVGVLIDWLFDPKYADAKFVLVAEALIAASQDAPDLAQRMQAWTRDFIAQVRQVLAATYASATPDHLNAVATGLTGIYFNTDSLTPLGAMTDVRDASKQAVQLLISTLEPPK